MALSKCIHPAWIDILWHWEESIHHHHHHHLGSLVHHQTLQWTFQFLVRIANTCKSLESWWYNLWQKILATVYKTFLSCSLGWIWFTHNTLSQSNIFLFSSSLIHQFSIRLKLWGKHWISLATSCGWRKRVDFERKWENPDPEAAQTGKERKSGFWSGERVNYSNLCHRRSKNSRRL